MQNKSDLRRNMLARRQDIAEVDRMRHEGVIIEHIRLLKSFAEASTIALYMPVRGEVDLLPLWKPEERRFVFPKVLGDVIAF